MLIPEAFNNYTKYINIKNYSKSQIEHTKKAGQLLYEFLGDIEVSRIGIDEIFRWKNWLTGSRRQNTVRQYVLVVRSVLKYCTKLGEACDEVDLIPVPRRENTTPSFLSAREVEELIARATTVRAKFVISLLYSSGIRVSELISLNRGQIHDKQFTVVGKGNKERVCFIDARTELLMGEYLEGRNDHCDALVVSRINKTRLNKSTIELIVKNAAKKAGITKHVTPHTLRHSFATNFLQNNGNMRYLADMLGHNSLDTTKIYTHIVNNDLRDQYLRHHSI